MKPRLSFSLALLLVPMTAAAMELPSVFDLRDINGRSFIGAVRNQGDCGSCYSFGALAAAESTWNRTHDLSNEQAIDLSEAFIVWNLSPLYKGFDGCNGTSYDYEELTALTKYGVPLERDFAYTIHDPGGGLHWDANRITFQDWYRIPVNDIETIKRVLFHIGAVDASISTDNAFAEYTGGRFVNDNTSIGHTIPQYTPTDHAIALVGWDDTLGADGLGAWILRNSWGSGWGEAGYMGIGYTSAQVATEATYLIAAPWSGESIVLENSGQLTATPWSAGGTLNAHGVDIWGGAASSVTNHGSILAEARGTGELTTARGVYLWGGPGGQATNSGDIRAVAASTDNQAIAYGICLQGGLVDNSGLLSAEARSQADQSLAFGVWAANGGTPLEVRNSGRIAALADSGDMNAAYGIWADSRAGTTLQNSGVIDVIGHNIAVGALLSGGPALLDNSGVIQAHANPVDGDAIGVLTSEPAVIINSGIIRGLSFSIFSLTDTLLMLKSGSDLIGPVQLEGSADRLLLAGSGSENDLFHGVETLIMDGTDWSLSGDSAFGAIRVEQGRLGIDGALRGDATVFPHGILGGNGTLTGLVVNFGTVAPGHSIGHLTIAGDFRQDASGTLSIEIGNGIADRLTVTGTAFLDGTLLILPDGYASSGSFTFLDAGSLSGAFSLLRSVAVLDVDLLSLLPGSLTLDVTRNSYASLSTPYNQNLAANLDAVRPTAGNDFGDLLNRLDLAFTQSELNESLSQLTPRIHGLATTLALDDGQARFDSLRRRMERTDQPSFAHQDAEATTSAWIEMPGHRSSYDSDGAYFGASKNLYGLMFGVERTALNGLTFGLAGAVTESRYQADSSGDEGENESLQGFLYGSWNDPQTAGGWRFGVALGSGVARFEADRAITFADRTSHSDHDGQMLGTTFQGGYDWQLDGWILGASLGGSWFNLDEEGFQESGAGSADLAIHSRETDSFQGFVGGRLAHPFRWDDLILEPELRLQWFHEFSRQTGDLNSRLAGGGDYFTTTGRDLSGDSLVIGTTLKARLTETIFAQLGYDCTLQSDNGAIDHALSLQLGWRF